MAKQTEKTFTEKEYKEAKADSEFTNLHSDISLRKKVEALIFENESDERGAAIISKHPTLTKFQRQWLSALIKRNGKKFEG